MLAKLTVSSKADKESNIEASSLVVMTDPSTLDQLDKKTVILFVSGSANKPKRSVLKLTSDPVCSEIKETPASEGTLSQGLYMALPLNSDGRTPTRR